MATRTVLGGNGACVATASAFGVLAGIGGLTHGVGEVLQGNVAVDGVFLDSWTVGPIARNMGGEPGLTILPTALSAGLLTLVLSCAVVVWSVIGVRRSHGGSVLVLLSLGMLLAGGGVGPPVIGMLAGAIGRWGPLDQPRWVGRFPPRTRRVLADVWAPLYVVALAVGSFLVIGSLVLVYTIDLDAASVFEASFYLIVLLLLLLIVSAPTHDARMLDTIETPAGVGAGSHRGTGGHDVRSPS